MQQRTENIIMTFSTGLLAKDPYPKRQYKNKLNQTFHSVCVDHPHLSGAINFVDLPSSFGELFAFSACELLPQGVVPLLSIP